MHQTLHSCIQCLSTMLLHHSTILWIFRRTWTQPHHLNTPVMEWMESWCRSDLMFESNSRIHCNLPAHSVFSLIPMGLITNPKTPWTVAHLAVTWWFRSGCYGITCNKVDIPWGFRLVNTGGQILVGKIRILVMQWVDQLEISSMCHLVDDTFPGLFHAGHCYYQDWFKGWYPCWMPIGWCCLVLHQAAGHRNQSQEQIQLSFLTNNAGKVIVHQTLLYLKGTAS